MKYLPNIIKILFLALFLFLLVNGKIMLWLALFAVSLLATLLFGRFYCGYICPMNTLMIPAELISVKLKCQSTKTPKWLKNGYCSWVALIVSVVAMLLAKKVWHIALPILPIWIVISVIFTLRYKSEIFHNLICPFGALQKTFGRYTRFSENVNEDACIGCKLCEQVCPSGAVVVLEENKKARINSSLCHQCTNCVLVCPKNAINYGNINKS